MPPTVTEVLAVAVCAGEFQLAWAVLVDSVITGLNGQSRLVDGITTTIDSSLAVSLGASWDLATEDNP